MGEVKGIDSIIHERVKGVVKELAIENDVLEPTTMISPQNEDGGNFMGQLFRLALVSRKNTNKLNLILKMMPMDEKMMNTIPLNLIYTREITMYTRILPQFDSLQKDLPDEYKFQHATCYKVTEENADKMLVFNDLSVEGFQDYETGKPLDLQHVMLVLTSMARFHAMSFVMRKKQPAKMDRLVEFLQDQNLMADFLKYVDFMGETTLGLMENEDEKGRLAAYTTEKLSEVYLKHRESAATEPYNVICHGDCSNNNILFKYRKDSPVDLRLIDWQMCLLASPVTDIAHFFFCSTESVLRRQCYPKILDYYYTELGEHLQRFKCDINDCYPKSVFEKQLKDIIPYGLTMAMVAMPFLVCDTENVPTCLDLVVDRNVTLSESCKCRLIEVVKDFFHFELI